MIQDVSSRIKNILREVTVQGDLFTDTFKKEDERATSIKKEIARLRGVIVGLNREIEDWKTRPYKSNNQAIKDSNGFVVSIGQVNERRRDNEIADRKLRIRGIEEHILELKVELNKGLNHE